MKQVWFSLKMLDDVLIHLHASLLLIIIQQPWHHFCGDFVHAQIFGDNLPNTVLCQVQLTCDLSNSQPIIATHHLPYPLDVDLSPACWRPPASGVIFHLLAPLFDLLCHSKTCVCNMVLSPCTCWSISSACDGVFPNCTRYFRFIHCLVFILRSSVLIAKGPEKEEVQTKACERKFNGCRKLRLQL